MHSLETLHLDGNRKLFGFFPDTSSLKNLATVTASQCNFTKAGPLSTSLQYLDLSLNGLSKLPEGIEDLGRLQTLLLQNNQIGEWALCGVATKPCSQVTYLPRFHWDELRMLVVSNNPLGVSAQQFIDSLSYLGQLADLQAANCSIIGDVVDFEIQKEKYCLARTRPWVGFKRLQSVDLHGNQLFAVSCPPESLREASVAGNKLASLRPCWLHPTGQLSRVDGLAREPGAVRACFQRGVRPTF